MDPRGVAPRRRRDAAAAEAHGGGAARPTRAPKVGEHTDDVLQSVLGYDSARIDALRAGGAFGG